VNWKGYGRKRPFPELMYAIFSWHVTEIPEENQEKPHAVYPVPGPAFEPTLSRIQSRRADRMVAQMGALGVVTMRSILFVA
jgi:hypothetical protein